MAERELSHYRVFVGFDADEMTACHIAIQSLQQHAYQRLDVRRISRLSLYSVYDRPTRRNAQGQLFDEISQAPMSTDHAIARFFVPWLCGYQGWALFVDGDILCRRDVAELFGYANDRYALSCVQHPPLMEEGFKKDGQIQQPYTRKNWSSVMLFNCGHEANRSLDIPTLNSWPGRDLHAFRWLQDDQIGALPAEWNYLVGVQPRMDNPAIVHYTTGVPSLPDHAADPFAEEWFAVGARAGYLDLRAASA